MLQRLFRLPYTLGRYSLALDVSKADAFQNGTSGNDPYYSILDLLIVPITDNHLRAISDVLDYNTDLEIFPFGVPHLKDEMTLKYYLHGITKVKKRLEALTGSEITDEKLLRAIKLCNRERQLFRELSLLRKSEQIPLTSKGFVALNHHASIADKEEMVKILELIANELKEKAGGQSEGPRILLTGSTLAMGDHKILDGL